MNHKCDQLSRVLLSLGCTRRIAAQHLAVPPTADVTESREKSQPPWPNAQRVGIAEELEGVDCALHTTERNGQCPSGGCQMPNAKCQIPNANAKRQMPDANTAPMWTVPSRSILTGCLLGTVLQVPKEIGNLEHLHMLFMSKTKLKSKLLQGIVSFHVSAFWVLAG